MSDSHTLNLPRSGAVDRPWLATVIALFMVAAVLVALASQAPTPPNPVEVAADQVPTIEDWHGNSASIRPAY